MIPKIQHFILPGLITVFVLGVLLQCSQEKDPPNYNGKAVSDTSRISAAELALLPAKGPFFHV